MFELWYRNSCLVFMFNRLFAHLDPPPPPTLFLYFFFFPNCATKIGPASLNRWKQEIIQPGSMDGDSDEDDDDGAAMEVELRRPHQRPGTQSDEEDDGNEEDDG